MSLKSIATKSALVVLLLHVDGACYAQDTTPEEAKQSVIYLGTEFVVDRVENKRRDILARELARQALLITIREELGLVACDQTLAEWPPKEASIKHLLLTERFTDDGQWRLQLCVEQGGDEGQIKLKRVWQKDYEVDYGKARQSIYAIIVPMLERDSRSVFIDALEAAGINRSGQSRELQPDSQGADLEEMQLDVDYIKQFFSVRLAHKRDAGELPTLGLLVRGYANLALLTEHQYNAVSDAFIARSWLYAQRACAAFPESRAAIWSRAYA